MISVISRTIYRLMNKYNTVPATLGLHNIYILPTGYGVLYLIILGGMLIGSINYNNNLGFLLTFLLSSLGLTGMLHTYSMLHGLRIESTTAVPVFAGEPIEVEVTLSAIHRPRTGICWYFDLENPVRINLTPSPKSSVIVPLKTDRRGFITPGWLRIACTYPLGLFRAWTRINTDNKYLVYPRPISAPIRHVNTGPAEGEGGIARSAGVNDFQGLSAYQAGDPPQRIYWQAYSRGRGLHTKTFADQTGGAMILDINHIKEKETEKKISILCFQVLQAHRLHQNFGLNLNVQNLPVGRGREHRERCLRALALYGNERD